MIILVMKIIKNIIVKYLLKKIQNILLKNLMPQIKIKKKKSQRKMNLIN